MDTLADFVRLETWLLLGGLAALVAYQMLTGRINMRAMLSDNWTDGFSPGRLQLLLLTLAGAAIMVMRLGGPDRSLEVPPELLVAVGGSNLVVQRFCIDG